MSQTMRLTAFQAGKIHTPTQPAHTSTPSLQVQEIERLQADAAGWAALSDDVRRERSESLADHEGHLRSDFYLAASCVRIMELTAVRKEERKEKRGRKRGKGEREQMMVDEQVKRARGSREENAA